MIEVGAATAAKAARSGRGISMRFGTLVMGLSDVVIALGLAVAGSSLWVSESFKENAADSATLMQAMRNQVTADMYHDTLRGVVFRAMYAAINYDTAMVKSAKAELEEYSASFRAVIAAQQPLDLPAGTKLRSLRATVGTAFTRSPPVAARSIAVSLRGYAAARVAVRLRGRTATGRTFTAQRMYITCATQPQAGTPPTLYLRG